ncbi:MAG: hypothetical protein AB8B49_05195, partial [Nitratireductor sp.]
MQCTENLGFSAIAALRPKFTKKLPKLPKLFTLSSALFLFSSQASFAQLVNTATVTGVPATGTLAPATATESVDLEDLAPSFSITNTPNTTSMSGVGTISYAINIDNTGNQSLTSPSLSTSLTQNGSTYTLTSGATFVPA